MIEALFNQPNYLAAKKTLDAVALRQEAITNNLANLETPGYKRVDLAPSFEQALEQRLRSRRRAAARRACQPHARRWIPRHVAVSKDGNTVQLEQELMRMNQNAMTHSLKPRWSATCCQGCAWRSPANNS